MKLIYHTLFGSHVYGTNVPESDHDYKAVYIPAARDILLQNVTEVINVSTKTDMTAKSGTGDVEVEIFSLQKYLNLLMAGQTVALDTLFAPTPYITVASNVWNKLYCNRDKLITKQSKSFVGYCRTQANKYGIRGSRMGEVRRVLEVLAPLPNRSTISDHSEELTLLCVGAEHTAWVSSVNKKNIQESFFQCCDRKVPITATVQLAKEIYQKVFDMYGHRSLQAKKNEGVDWKALMHAVRISREAVELLSTGFITHPRPEAPLLLQIRKGELSYKQVAEIIEEGLIDTERAADCSILREEPDRIWAEEFVYETYLEEVVNA